MTTALQVLAAEPKQLWCLYKSFGAFGVDQFNVPVQETDDRTTKFEHFKQAEKTLVRSL